jgi:diacylglycerol kinase
MNYCNFIPRVDEASNKCCAEHDFQYSKQGLLSRAKADRNLRICVAKNFPIYAWVGWFLVRIFGWYYWKKDEV